MRRTDREITDFHEMMEILKSCDCCRIGLLDGQEAYIVPMNFGYEECGEHLTLYFHSAGEGKKMELLKQQTAITFEMDTRHELVEGDVACAYSYLYQSVMGSGIVTVLQEPAEKKYALQRIMAHYSGQTEWTFQDEMVKKVAVFKIDVLHWSCKAHKQVVH